MAANTSSSRKTGCRLPPPEAVPSVVKSSKFDVEQQQVVAGVVGHLDPFAARGAVQLDMQG